jgi:hypothetical protein
LPGVFAKAIGMTRFYGKFGQIYLRKLQDLKIVPILSQSEALTLFKASCISNMDEHYLQQPHTVPSIVATASVDISIMRIIPQAEKNGVLC